MTEPLRRPYLSPTPLPYGATIPLEAQVGYLLGHLARHMRSLSGRLDNDNNCAEQYKKLFSCLSGQFDLAVHNLNYDNVALSSLSDAYTGFSDQGIFEPRVVHNRREWGVVYHLQGSVHHSLTGQLGQIFWKNDLRDSDNFTDEQPARPGGFKLDQLLIEPFRSLHASFVRHLYEADAILMGGYGDLLPINRMKLIMISYERGDEKGAEK